MPFRRWTSAQARRAPRGRRTTISRGRLLPLRPRERGYPGILGPARPVPRNFDVDQIGLAVRGVPFRARQSSFELRWVLRTLAVHAKPLRDRRHVDVRLAEVVVYELAGIDRTAGASEICLLYTSDAADER